jgi:hypothetical protein
MNITDTVEDVLFTILDSLNAFGVYGVYDLLRVNKFFNGVILRYKLYCKYLKVPTKIIKNEKLETLLKDFPNVVHLNLSFTHQNYRHGALKKFKDYPRIFETIDYTRSFYIDTFINKLSTKRLNVHNCGYEMSIPLEFTIILYFTKPMYGRNDLNESIEVLHTPIKTNMYKNEVKFKQFVYTSFINLKFLSLDIMTGGLIGLIFVPPSLKVLRLSFNFNKSKLNKKSKIKLKGDRKCGCEYGGKNLGKNRCTCGTVEHNYYYIKNITNKVNYYVFLRDIKSGNLLESKYVNVKKVHFGYVEKKLIILFDLMGVGIKFSYINQDIVEYPKKWESINF